MESYKYGLEVSKLLLEKHYDEMSVAIDLRTETLVQLIHQNSDILREELEVKRKKSISELHSVAGNYLSDVNSLDQEYINKTISINDLVNRCNNLQKTLDELKSKRWKFVENTFIVEKCFIGYHVNTDVNFMFNKLKNLQNIISDDSKRHDIRLFSLLLPRNSIRQYVFVFNRNRFLKTYILYNNRVYIELFSHTGLSIRTVYASNSQTSNSVFANNESFFVISYDTTTSGILSSFLAIYDIDLNLIKTVQEASSVESLYMNDRNIVVTFLRADLPNCFKIYDFNLNLIQAFGQYETPTRNFYFVRNDQFVSDLDRLKLNPIIFGLTEKLIYFFNRRNISVMSRERGELIHSFKKPHESSKFALDSKANILEINTPGNFIKMHNLELNMCITGSFISTFEKIVLIEDKYLAFMNHDKQRIIIV